MTLRRTPAERFTGLPDFEYDPAFVDVGEPRMAHVEAGDGDPILCLHGEPTWSFLYRKMIPPLSEKGRVVAPDFIGFGRSEKYTEIDDYTFEMHYNSLVSFIEKLELDNITLVCQDWGSILGLTAAANNPGRFARIVAMNALLPDGTVEMPDVWHSFHDLVVGADELDFWRIVDTGCVTDLSDEVKEGYNAPFPDESYKAGARAWPPMVPTSPDDEGADRVAEAREKLAEWDKPAFVLFSDSDPITRDFAEDFHSLFPTADKQPDVRIERAGHFLQEDNGEDCAEEILAFVERT
ncbi:MAG: haloalkane dehalogenase [Halobacteria archaeon]|nr:haloalkane dehalogenase [Halobacteria archaeon]